MPQAVLPNGQIVFHDWYASEIGKWLMQATDGGSLMFMWEALYKDEVAIHQFDDVNWMRALRDPDFVPPANLRLSISALERERVSKFILHPIAMVKKLAPWFQQPIDVNLDLGAGDRFVNFWEVDFSPRTGYSLRRHVVGIERNGSKLLVVISPSGKITVCSNTNQSFEGE